MTRRAHLVGSVGLEDTRTVFEMVTDILGPCCTRLPDGETGARHYWIRWQRKVFAEHPHMELAQGQGYREGSTLELFRIREGVAPESLEFGAVGYAQAALESYALFARMKANGAIAAGTRFQVSIPTPIAVVTGFVAPECQAAVEVAYEPALLAELDTIIDGIPNDELAVQWDCCFEILAYDSAFPLHYTDILAGSLERLARFAERIPESVELGYHLCYGDPGHKHIKEPADTASAVVFANGLTAQIPRRVDWIHLPVPRERNDDAYFAPLADLALASETELVLGLVHHTDGIEGTRARIATAEQVVNEFSVATECGFGRRDADTIPELLKIHRAVCD